MDLVESRPLRYFVAVAEELSFARAAERLGIAQPALSRAIAKLETQLGVRLLERTTRHVALTDAGAVLLEEVRGPLEGLEAAARRAQRAGAPRHRLVVAVKADLDGGVLEDAMAAYARDRSAVPLEVELCGWGEPPSLLRDGRADVALLYAPFEDRGTDHDVLLEEPQHVALAADHPLARQPGVHLADLAEHFAPWPGMPHLWLPHDTAERPAFDGLPGLLMLVELGRLAVVLPASVLARYVRPQLAHRPLVDAEPAQLVVAWPQASTSLAAAAFVRAVSDVAAALRPRAGARTG
jgi:DNA-binding transcriptional LysR family regulator